MQVDLIELKARLVSWDEEDNWVVFETREDPNINSSGVKYYGGKWSLRVSCPRLGKVASLGLMKWVLSNSMNAMIGKEYDLVIEVRPYWNRNKKYNKMLLYSLEMCMRSHIH